MRPILRPMLLLFLAGMLAAAGVCAKQPETRDGRHGNDQGNGDRGNNGQSNLPESVRRVERQTGGEVLRAEPMQRDGREVYRVKVLTSDGRVRVIQDDPQQPRRSDNPPRGGNRGRPRNDDAADDSGGDPG